MNKKPAPHSIITRLLTLVVGVIVSLAFAPDSFAVIFRTSQLSTNTTISLGSFATEGWSGGGSILTVTNGSGSLDGTSLGLVASVGDRATATAGGTGINNLWTNLAVHGLLAQNFASPTNLYMSFLCRIGSNGIGGGTNFIRNLRANSGTWANGTLAIWLKQDGSGNVQFGATLKDGVPSYSTTLIPMNQTVLVVARHSITNGADNDRAEIWVNPGSLGVAEGSVPAADAGTTDGVEDSSNTGPGRTYVNGYGGFYEIDEFRWATTWAEVTPASGPCVGVGITTEPVAQSACENNTVQFTVVASGTGPIYRWAKNGTPLANGPTGNGSTYSGVTTPTLAISAVTLADAALAAAGFDCIITNACGSTNTARVALTVNGSPTAFAMTGGGSDCVGGPGVAVGLSGSESGVTYYLKLNGVNNGTTASGTGSALSFGSVTVAGTYTAVGTNGTGCSTAMTTNAIVVINAQPGITTQPVGVTTAVGGSATYSVVATGGGITYQWNKNGSTISAATNASYTLYPATLGDAAIAANGFDCTITGPCGSTNSARVELVVNAASNLIWAGDGAGNLWNTLGAANWSNGVSLVQFTSGDSVTCDDTSPNPVVNLSGTQVPTSVTVNSSSNYVFATGAVGGSLATVSKSGTGSLTIVGAQTYGGGTVINNGTLAISNNAALGTGSATLAGGGLTTLRTLSIPNGINATASSALTYNGTGDSALVLNGAFSVAGGATLTINHAAAGPDRLRVFDTNSTSNGDIVLNGAGIALAFYSASGVQTFNGVISGNGQVMRRSGVAAISGTTILSGANTYSGPTTLTDGSIGIGSSTVGAITSGPVGTGTLALGDSGNAPSLKHLFAVGAAQTIANPITVAGAQTNTVGGTFALTLDGTVNLGAATRVFNITNTATTTLNGIISNGGLTKLGNGTLVLNGQNTYTGPTVINGGTLGGTGQVRGPVTIAVGGNLAPGNSIGALTVTNDLVLGGTFTAEVNTGASPNCDQITGLSNVVYGGTLAIVNTGPAHTASDTFQLFSALTYNGAFASITPATPGASLTWNTNTLTTDGTLRITSAGGGPSTNADLSGLVVAPAAALSPAFNSNTTTYAASEAYANSPITVTPTSVDAGAVIQVIYGGATNVVTSSNPSGPLTLDANPSVPNVVQVRVTAADTTTVKSYTVTVTRQPSTTQPTLTNVSSGGNLTLSWPSDHLGWTLQTQTNTRSVGLVPATNAWFNVAGSASVTNIVIPVGTANPTVFYRLMLFVP